MTTIQRILLAISHSGNLAIYCISSKKFRTVLRQKMFGFLRSEDTNNQRDNMELTTFIASAKINNQHHSLD